MSCIVVQNYYKTVHISLFYQLYINHRKLLSDKGWIIKFSNLTDLRLNAGNRKTEQRV